LKEELSEIKKLLREIARNGSNSSLQNWYVWDSKAKD
jgi:hypothetical protein